MDEGAIWVRGTLAPSTNPAKCARVPDRPRQILCSFPEVPQVVNQIGRPDDGTDTNGFFDTEFFVDLLPKDKWRPVFHEDKERLIAAMDRELEKIPGVSWGFSECVRNVLEKNESEDDMLVLGRIHVAAHLIRRLPQLLLEPEVCSGSVGFFPGSLWQVYDALKDWICVQD